MKKKLLYFISVMAVLLVFVLLINSDWFDEDLLPEVQAIKDIKAELYQPGNGYIGIMALNHEPKSTFKKTSEKLRQSLNEKILLTGLDYLTDTERVDLIGKSFGNEWRKNQPNCNGRKQLGCTEEWLTHIKQLDWTDPHFITQLERYAQLIESTHYKEPHFFDFSGTVTYRTAMLLSKVRLSQALDSDEFLQSAEKDFNFWQMMMNESNYLMSHMIAIAALHHHIHTFSYAIKQNILTPEQLVGLNSRIDFPHNNALANENVFKHEFKFGMGMLNQVEAEKSWYQRLDFFQPKATHNINYQSMFPTLKNLVKLDTQSFADQKKQISKTDFKPPNIWSLHMLYNPTGKLYSEYANALPAYTDYISRSHDLNAKWMLLKLQIDIAMNHEQPIEQVMTSSKYQNPITGQPFNYNAADGTIGFECLEQIESNCRLQIH